MYFFETVSKLGKCYFTLIFTSAEKKIYKTLATEGESKTEIFEIVMVCLFCNGLSYNLQIMSQFFE